MSTQIIEMFKQSNSRMNSIMKDKTADLDRIGVAQREFEGEIKLINAVVSAYGIMSKNARAKDGLNRMNILDDTTAIDLGLGDPEIDKVKCPMRDGTLILRQECLDYSGQADHMDECKGCEIGQATKRLLCPVPIQFGEYGEQSV